MGLWHWAAPPSPSCLRHVLETYAASRVSWEPLWVSLPSWCVALGSILVFLSCPLRVAFSLGCCLVGAEDGNVSQPVHVVVKASPFTQACCLLLPRVRGAGPGSALGPGCRPAFGGLFVLYLLLLYLTNGA